jgi:hypothetical protein
MAHPTDPLVAEAAAEGPAACVSGGPADSKPVDALAAAMAFDLKVRSNGEVGWVTGSVAVASLEAHGTVDELEMVRNWRAMLPVLVVEAAVLNRIERVEPVVSAWMAQLGSGWHCAPSHRVVGVALVVWGEAEVHRRDRALGWGLEARHRMVGEVVEEGSAVAVAAVGSVRDERLVAR